MAFGSQADFFNGPEVRLGTPWPRILEGMVSDHIDQADSKVKWTTRNYKVLTDSHTEFCIVAQELIAELRSVNAHGYPQAWIDAADKLSRIPGISSPIEWPAETINKEHPRRK